MNRQRNTERRDATLRKLASRGPFTLKDAATALRLGAGSARKILEASAFVKVLGRAKISRGLPAKIYGFPGTKFDAARIKAKHAASGGKQRGAGPVPGPAIRPDGPGFFEQLFAGMLKNIGATLPDDKPKNRRQIKKKRARRVARPREAALFRGPRSVVSPLIDWLPDEAYASAVRAAGMDEEKPGGAPPTSAPAPPTHLPPRKANLIARKAACQRLLEEGMPVKKAARLSNVSWFTANIIKKQIQLGS